MKRALIVLLMLAVAAGGLFAQISFGMSAKSGLRLAYEDDATFATGNYSFEFKASAAAKEDGKAGAETSFKVARGGTGDVGAYVWLKPSDFILLGLGTKGPEGFKSLGKNDTSNGVNDSDGFHLKVLEPIAGLNIGLTINPAGVGKKPTDSTYRAGVALTQSAFGTAANFSYSGETEVANAAVGFNLRGLPSTGLTGFGFDASFTNVTKLMDEGTITLGPKFGFKFGDLGANLSSLVYVPVGAVSELDLLIDADASYPVATGVTAKLGARWNKNGAVANTNGTIFAFGSGDVGSGASTEKSMSLGVQPSLEIAVGSATVVLGYGLHTQIGGENGATKHMLYTNWSIDF